MSNKQISITMTDRGRAMIDEIMEKGGHPSVSTAIHHCIATVHMKLFPAYNSSKIGDLDPEARVKRKEAIVTARKISDAEKNLAICNALGGEIVNNGGTKVCHFFNYSKTSRYPQKMPLDQLTDDLIGLQYFPSKEIVEKYQTEGKTEYAVKKKKS